MDPGGGGLRRNVVSNDDDVASGTTLFLGDLHWWTTEAEIEVELRKYGQVKDVKYFAFRDSGKSKGFCRVDFHDPIAAAACEEGMNGHIFNGRPCVVALASPRRIAEMGELQINRNRRMTTGAVGNNFGGGGSWGRRGGGILRKHPGPAYVPPRPPVLHPGGSMLRQGFNPMATGFGGAAMGGMAAGFRSGFPPGSGGAAFPRMMTPPPTSAPHFNRAAFFGQGPATAGQVGTSCSDYVDMGRGRGGQEQSSYGEAASHGKSRMAERDDDPYGGGSERRHERERDDDPYGGGSERRHERKRDDDPYGGGGGGGSERRHERERERDSGRQMEMNWERDRERNRDIRDRDHRDHRDRRDRRDHRDHRDRDREKEEKRLGSRSQEVEHSKRRRQ